MSEQTKTRKPSTRGRGHSPKFRVTCTIIAVALMGVMTAVRGLDQPGKIVYGPDLSNEGGLPNVANLDTYGPGTHLAGIIAGDDGDQVGGIATGSRIVSVKVAGATGETNIAQVIAAIDWVIEHKNDNDLKIRVLNVSLGVGGVASSAGDPLSAASSERGTRASSSLRQLETAATTPTVSTVRPCRRS